MLNRGLAPSDLRSQNLVLKELIEVYSDASIDSEIYLKNDLDEAGLVEEIIGVNDVMKVAQEEFKNDRQIFKQVLRYLPKHG